MKLSFKSQSPFRKILLIGDSGAGKTTATASFPGPVLMCDFDGKVDSAAQFLAVHNPAQLELVEYNDYSDYGKFSGKKITAVEQFNKDMGDLAKITPFPYKTIVVDSLTLFSDASMEYLMKLNHGIKRTVTNGVQIPALQDYQMARIWFKQIIGAMLALPCHVVFTAHIQTEKDELSGQILRSPMMAGKLSKELPIYFGEVWRAYRDDKGQHWAQTQSDSKFVCRSQIPGLPNPLKLDHAEIAKWV